MFESSESQIATTNLEDQLALLCPKCKKLMNEPRMGRCGHSYCKVCLEGILQAKATENTKGVACGSIGGIVFQCPQTDCEIPQYLLPSASIEHFPANFHLQKRIEDMKIREKETICAKHNKRCKLFCNDSNCMQEICWKCIEAHPGHIIIEKEKAFSEYQSKYWDCSDRISGELKTVESTKKELSVLIDTEESKLAKRVTKLFEVFLMAENTMMNEQVECITKTLQEMEFKAPSRSQLEIERRASPLQDILRIGQPIFQKPGKQLNELVYVFQAAESRMTKYKKVKTEKPVRSKMKAPLQEFLYIQNGFLYELADKYRPRSRGI